MKRNFKNEFKSFLIIEMKRKTRMDYSAIIQHVNEFITTEEGEQTYRKWANAKLIEYNKGRPKQIGAILRGITSD